MARYRLTLDIPDDLPYERVRVALDALAVTVRGCQRLTTDTTPSAAKGEGKPALTPTERAILHSFTCCNTVAQICARHHVSPDTVRTHCRAIFAKLAVHSRSVAIVRALQFGLLDLEEVDG